MPLDLALTLLACLSIFFMGVVTYFHDRSSFSNALFFFISLATVFWSIANYFSLNTDALWVLFWIRLVLFFALPHVVLLFLFIYTFPERFSHLSFRKLSLIFILLAGTMALTISPLVFSGLDKEAGGVVPTPGQFMPVVVLVILGSLVGSLVLIVKKYREAKDLEKIQWRFMLVGISLSYFLLILTNFLFVILFRSTYFVQFGPLFMLPASIGTGYAIMRHHLLNVKTIATEILTFIILVISLFDVFSAQGAGQLMLRLVIFSLFFVFGIFLIRSVLKEVKQREKLEVLTKELEAANDKLKALDKVKSEFLSFASHQVKAPMAAVKGFASLIFDGTYGVIPEAVKEAARRIQGAADRMIALVNNILNLRRIEEGKMEYKMAPLKFGEMLSEIVEGLRPLAIEKKVTLTLEKSLTEETVMADYQKLGQVFQNLIENAIKYTEQGGVTIEVKTLDSRKVTIQIKDTGRGMSAETLERIFEPFSRGQAMAGATDGTGLGLFIAKQIVLAHQGKIGAESRGEGQGSVFTVVLPLAKASQ